MLIHLFTCLWTSERKVKKSALASVALHLKLKSTDSLADVIWKSRLMLQSLHSVGFAPSDVVTRQIAMSAY